MNDSRCPLCNFRISEAYSAYMVDISRSIAEKLKLRFGGVILPCPECLPPVVIPQIFR